MKTCSTRPSKCWKVDKHTLCFLQRTPSKTVFSLSRTWLFPTVKDLEGGRGVGGTIELSHLTLSLKIGLLSS